MRSVTGRVAGSGFGWRSIPITGQSALHTGLDFQAAQARPSLAAAGGVVVTQEYHPAYRQHGRVDHGTYLVTRYAHASRVLVKQGDIVRRGQKIAEIGTTGRSTGPHLHFEVLVQGVFQNPQKFSGMRAVQPPRRSRPALPVGGQLLLPRERVKSRIRRSLPAVAMLAIPVAGPI